MKKLVLLCLFMASNIFGQQLEQDVTKVNYTVTGEETLTASRSITFRPTTWIKAGATFHAYITDYVGTPYSLPSLSETENYVFTRVYQKPMSTSVEDLTNLQGLYIKDFAESVSYFDGLGRGKQSIAIKQSSDKKDIVTHFDYDDFGRQEKEFLPYPSTGNDGSIKTGAELATLGHYKTHYGTDFPNLTTANVNAFSQKNFEDSPLNRVLSQAAPGEDWKQGNGHEIEFAYETNITGEVRLFQVNITETSVTVQNENVKVYTPSLVSNDSHYTAGTLYKTITKDENWTSGLDHTTEEFKNKQGQVILKRTYNNQIKHDTYYIYDDYGNLTYVLSPKVNTDDGVSSIELSELCYQYKYDARNRLVEKKIPGKDWEYIIYDGLDRPVLTQDANLRVNKKWLFTKYDALGRVVYTGIYTHGTNLARPNMQAEFNRLNDTATKYYEEKSATAINGAHYTNANFPLLNIEVLTINYYDTYENVLPTGLGNTVTTYYNLTSTTRLKGLATVSKVKVLDTSNWITTVSYYDEKARPIYVYSKNDFLGTTDIVESKLDFVGKVEETKTSHQKETEAAIVTIDSFTYDHAGRVVTQKQKINNQSEETIAKNTYDQLGQLETKGVGGANGTLQTVDYVYNVRGWLKNINQDNKLNDNDLFNFTIAYNNPTTGANPLYNGNISETLWDTKNDNKLRKYQYDYDALNRLLSANYFANLENHNFSVFNIQYDKNGNIKQLKRNRKAGQNISHMMDNLSYTYNENNLGNKLINVSDSAPSLDRDFGFKDGTNGGDDYRYDANGNMTSDENKNISNIEYNHLNLPTEIRFSNVTRTGEDVLGTIYYVYDATGTKLQKTVVENSGTRPIAPVTQYTGNYVYKNGSLEFFNHAEGYVSPDNTGSFKYTYQYKDHLGNVRLSYTDNNGDGVITPSSEIIEESNYYPFGLKHKGYNNNVSSLGNSTAQKFKYNGIELEESLGLNLYEMDYRMYDPAIARFNGIDPVTHHSQGTSVAFDNNPIFYADPSGGNSESTTDFINRLFRTSASGTTWTNNGNGTFSDGNGNTEECKRCKELERQRKKLTAKITDLTKAYHSSLKTQHFLEEMGKQSAINGLALEYANKIKTFTKEQLEYLEKNPDKVNDVIKEIIKESVSQGMGIPFSIPKEAKGEDIANALSSLKDRGVLLMNIANKYISTTIKIMHKSAKTNTYNIKRKIRDAQKNLNSVNDELHTLDAKRLGLRALSNGQGLGGGDYGGGGANGSWEE